MHPDYRTSGFGTIPLLRLAFTRHLSIPREIFASFGCQIKHGRAPCFLRSTEEEMNAKVVALSATVIGLIFATSVRPCSISRPVSNLEMVTGADVIVRATAEDYAVRCKKS